MDRLAEARQLRDAGAMTPTEYRLIVAEEQERALAMRLAGFGLGVVTRRHNETGTGARASKTRQASPQNVIRATVEEAPNPKPTNIRKCRAQRARPRTGRRWR